MSVTANGVFAFSGCCDLYLSQDGGRTWRARATFSDTLIPASSVVQIADSNFMVRNGSRPLLYASVDTGRTWSVVDQLPNEGTSLATDGVTLFRLDERGLANRVDGEWVEMLVETDGGGKSAWFYTDPVYQYILYISLQPNRSFLSKDGGETWWNVKGRFARPFCLDRGVVWGASSQEVFSMYARDTTWMDYLDLEDLSASPAGILVKGNSRYVYNYRGVYDWSWPSRIATSDSEGLNGFNVTRLFTGGGQLLASDKVKIFKLRAGNDTWRIFSGPDNGDVIGLGYRDGKILATGGILKTLWWLDEGLGVWEPYGTLGVRKSIGGLYVDRDRIVVGGFPYLYNSADGGKTWDSTAFDISSGFLSIVGSGDTVVALSNALPPYIVISTDGGQSWTGCHSPPTRLVTVHLAFGNGMIYAGTVDSGLYRSEDLGDSWKKVRLSEDPLEDKRLSRVQTLRVFGDSVFTYVIPSDTVATIGGGRFFVSTSSGKHWREFLVPGDDVMDVVPFQGSTWIGTKQHSVLKTEATLGIESDRAMTGVSLRYDQRMSILAIDLDQGGDCRIDLVDVKGRVIRQVVNGYLAAGANEVPLSVSALPSGMYFASFTIDGQQRETVPVRIVQ